MVPYFYAMNACEGGEGEKGKGGMEGGGNRARRGREGREGELDRHADIQGARVGKKFIMC